MATDWTFLEPWCAALRASFVRNVPTDSSNEMQVSFVWPFRGSSQRVLSFRIDLEAEVPHNVIKLIQIQEAIELFTFLSNVDNKAFRERFQPITQWTSGDKRWYPSWRLDIRGSVTLQQATWSSLFESSDTSPQYQRAIEKLKRMELEDTSKDYLSSLYDIRIEWACKFDGADVNMYANLIADSNEMFIKTVPQRLFKAGVPLAKQLGLTGEAATLVDSWRNQGEADEEQVPMDISLRITIRDFTTTYSRILTGLAWLPIRSLEMFFNKGRGTAMMRAQVYSNRDYPVVCYKFMLKSDIISNSVLAAIYSIQAMRSDTDSIWIFVDSVDSESWPLLMRLICCGPAVGISLTINAVQVTNSDLVKIADFTVSWRSRIGNEISHDSERRNLQVSSEFCRLQLHFTDFESGALVINLLGLIGRNLRSLTVTVAYRFDMTLDLSQLSVVCPNLEYLLACRIHVVVSAHTDALRLWPIQDLRLDNYSQLSDLALCLRNPTLRMTHELMSIRIREFRGKECNEGLKRDLLIHDGDFLSIRKEKVPIRSKVAMISAVSCARKTIHGLHEDVLGLIFDFASTPATRSVCFWTKDS